LTSTIRGSEVVIHRVPIFSTLLSVETCLFRIVFSHHAVGAGNERGTPPSLRLGLTDTTFYCPSQSVLAEAAFYKKTTLFTSILDLNFGKELVKRCIWSIALYGAETWTRRKIDEKYLNSFEM